MDMKDTEEIVYHKDQMSFNWEEDQTTYIEANCKKWKPCSYSGSFFLDDEEYGEPIEFTEDELIQEIGVDAVVAGIYFNEFTERV